MEISDKKFHQNMMTAFIQIAAVTLIILWCYTIVRPFVNIVLWALIISVALYPLHQSLSAKLGGREKTSAVIFTLVLLGILIIPSWYLTESTVSGLSYVATGIKEGTLEVPPPDASVRDWPLVGRPIYEFWATASQNITSVIAKYSEQMKGLGEWFVGVATSSVGTVFLFIASILVAGVFLVSADGGYRLSRNIGKTLSDDHGASMVDMAIATIRSVAKGVLGVAFIQAILSAIGLVAIGVPAAGLWAGLILVLAIVQLPPLIVLGPITVWIFSVAEPVPATIFAVYAFIVSISDSFLKPMFLGRGMDIPMLVILLGAIGGAITSGIIGLFVGAIVLAVGYKLMVTWMVNEQEEPADATQAAEES